MMVIVCSSPREQPDPERLLAIYRSEPLRRLRALHDALNRERQAATNADTVAFCDFRIPLVEQVISELEADPPRNGRQIRRRQK